MTAIDLEGISSQHFGEALMRACTDGAVRKRSSGDSRPPSDVMPYINARFTRPSALQIRAIKEAFAAGFELERQARLARSASGNPRSTGDGL